MKILTQTERDQKINEIVSKLKAGETVKLIDASFSAFGVCIGDFREMGWSIRNTWRTGMNWTWVGPGKVDLDGQILKFAGQSEEVDMRWT